MAQVRYKITKNGAHNLIVIFAPEVHGRGYVTGDRDSGLVLGELKGQGSTPSQMVEQRLPGAEPPAASGIQANGTIQTPVTIKLWEPNVGTICHYINTL